MHVDLYRHCAFRALKGGYFLCGNLAEMQNTVVVFLRNKAGRAALKWIKDMYYWSMVLFVTFINCGSHFQTVYYFLWQIRKIFFQVSLKVPNNYDVHFGRKIILYV